MEKWDYHIVNIGMTAWSRVNLFEYALAKETEDGIKDFLKSRIKEEQALWQKEIEYFLKWKETTTALDYASK